MAYISISPTELRSKANDLENLRQSHLSIMKDLRILILGLSDSWKGEAQNAFLTGYLDKNVDLNNFSSMLEDFIKLANTAADKAETMDHTLLAKVKSMIS